jgi:serine/threonine protein kinase
MLNRKGKPTGQTKQLLVIKELGRGGNGTVWRVREQLQGKTRSWWGRAAGGAAAPAAADLALKVAMPYEEMSEEYRGRCSRGEHGLITCSILRSEHCIMEDARVSPYVLDSYGMGRVMGLDGCNVYCLLLELAEGGSLDQLVRPGGVPKGVKPEDAHELMKGIMKGLCSVHEDARAIHRDLKCSNIVLTKGGGGDAGAGGSRGGGAGSRQQQQHWHPKLIDFDAALRVGSSMDALGTTWNIGTPAFAAPEMREGFFHDSRVDSYQLGLTFVELRFGELVPFHHLWTEVDDKGLQLSEEDMEEQDERRLDLVAELERPDCPYNQDFGDGRVQLTAAELDFLKRCLQPDVRRRETVGMLCSSVYHQEGPYAKPCKGG